MAARRYEIRAPRPVAPVYRMPRGFQYTSPGVPCSSKRALEAGRCKVQLIFRNGVPHLRFCEKAGKPGRLLPVESPTEARLLSKKICACLTRKKGATAEACLPKGLTLGGIRRKKPKKKGRR